MTLIYFLQQQMVILEEVIWLILLESTHLVKLQLGDVTFLGEEFWEAAKIIPIISLAYLFHALYLLQLPGVYLLEKPGWITCILGIGAFSNIILNLLFIPRYGIVGAAWATCISFVLMAVIFYMINRQIFHVSYNWK